MKKFFTLIAATSLYCVSAMATTFTFTSADAVSQTIDGITVKLEKSSGNNAPFFSTAGEMRLYANNTITVSGADLSSIYLSFSKQGSKEYATLSCSPGSLVSGGVSTSNTDIVTDTWTGPAQSVTFTLGSTGQRIITQLVVNGDPSDIPSTPDPDDPDDPSGDTELIPDFDYPEPTYLPVPALTVQGAAYKFVETNVLVECTTGAITGGYYSAHAGNSITFTATENIKGLVINGYVKKGFTATATSGSIDYITPDEDTEADPVLVLTDVNAKSVTISCDKQLRCYMVEIYFDANPEVTVGGDNGEPGRTEDLNFDLAEAVYESWFSEAVGEPNYSIFLGWIEDDYRYFALDIYPEVKDVLAGTYSFADYTLDYYTYFVYGEGDDDITYAYDGEVTISKNGDIYTINGTIACENNVTYNISYTGEMPIYNDDEYYGDGDDDGDDDDAGVAEINDLKPTEGIMYDITGRKVNKGYRGIYIMNGKKFVGK